MIARPLLFGILNITEDSFSDGAKYLAPEVALGRAETLIGDGADVLDLGAASSNPNAQAVSPDIEIARLAPVVARGREKGWSLSIDSFAVETQRWALGEGVAYLNDIQGFPFPEFYPELAAATPSSSSYMPYRARDAPSGSKTDAATIMERIEAFFASPPRSP